MLAFFIVLLILLAGSILAMIFVRRAMALWLGFGAAALASLIGLVWSLHGLLSRVHHAVSYTWSLPYAAFTFSVDSLAAFFLMVIFLISFLVAIHAITYFRPYAGQIRCGLLMFSFNALIAGMALVVTAANGILFLMAWEIMSFAAYFLIVFDDKKAEIRHSGYIYLIATHIGTAFLFVLFWLLAMKSNGSMAFADFSAFRTAGLAAQVVAASLAVLGFGAKAGIVPLHVWLPEAHPAAPSPVSALMSAVMIKTGIYGILRIYTLLALPVRWWAYGLIALGLVTGLLGIFFAMMQRDLKRSLAYSSIENIGIILIGIGIGSLGIALRNSTIALLGFAGALLHILNHALFKALLFMSAGMVVQKLHHHDMEKMGGLHKRLPRTGTLFIIAATAVCGLPPLNGFVSEFLIYLAAFSGVASPGPAGIASSLIVIIALSLIGAVALATFAKIIGIVFLGAPRSPEIDSVHESSWAIHLPLMVIALLLFAIGLFPDWILRLILPATVPLTGMTDLETATLLAPFSPVLRGITVTTMLFGFIFVCLYHLRKSMLKKRAYQETETWGCGYLAPTPRMQYTSASFADSFIGSVKKTAGLDEKVDRPTGLFPKGQSFRAMVQDTFITRLYAPFFEVATRVLGVAQKLQHGRLPLYILYITVMLLLLLVWYGGLR